MRRFVRLFINYLFITDQIQHKITITVFQTASQANTGQCHLRVVYSVTQIEISAQIIQWKQYNHRIKAIFTSCAGGRHNMPRPCKLTFNLLTLKVVSELRVTWASSVSILVFLDLSCYAPPLIGGALSDDAVWRLSVAYIGPKSRTEKPKKTKIVTEVAHVTRDSDTTLKVKRSKVKVTRPLYSARHLHIRQLQRWAGESIHRGNLLLRCRLQVGSAALRRPHREERGGVYR